MYPCLLVIIRGRLVEQILMYASPFLHTLDGTKLRSPHLVPKNDGAMRHG
jgi:hypothetical protein